MMVNKSKQINKNVEHTFIYFTYINLNKNLTYD